MDQVKTGSLIRQLRTQRGLTQKQLADRIGVSDKAVSKWECGSGCPDIALLAALAEEFGTDIRVLLTGEPEKNEREKGNMKKLKFYICRECGNFITAASEASVTCCGSRLTAEAPREAAADEMLHTEEIDGEWYITSGHEMTKAHFISFVAYVNDRSVMLFRQYPEWDLQVTLPPFRSGKLIWYCDRCGLLSQELCPRKTK